MKSRQRQTILMKFFDRFPTHSTPKGKTRVVAYFWCMSFLLMRVLPNKLFYIFPRYQSAFTKSPAHTTPHYAER